MTGHAGFPERVRIVEVSARDGLQNESVFLSTPDKIAFIDQLSQLGFDTVEVTSFVNRRAVPQLADAEEVFAGIARRAGIRYPVLVPNTRGLGRALSVGAKDIAFFTAASDAFSRHNNHCTIAESLDRLAEIVEMARPHGSWIRGYISCVLGCPYEGSVAIDAVAALAARLFELGCDEISLGDTFGIGTPCNARDLFKAVAAAVPRERLALHFHDTYGQALANIFACLQHGASIIDTALAGMGGCPYAQGAGGNVATEDVVYMLDGMGIETGLDLGQLIGVGNLISKRVGRENGSRVGRAVTRGEK